MQGYVSAETSGENVGTSLILWNALRAALPFYREFVKNEWESLLVGSARDERKILQFLGEHAGFFFCDSQRQLITISELEMAADYRPDFVVPYDQSSRGYLYQLIECEKPDSHPFTKSGKPSHELMEAYKQILDWKRWVESHRTMAKEIFPSSDFSIHDQFHVEYTIYIGRREQMGENVHVRNQIAKEWQIEIRSFDALTQRLLHHPFFGIPKFSSSEMNGVDNAVKNAIVNPFRKAIPSGAWRKIAPHLKQSHTSANSMDALIAGAQVHTELYSAFVKDLEKIPPSISKYLLDEVRGMPGFRKS